MIKNDREYRITKAQAAEFEQSLLALGAETTSGVHPIIRQAQRDAVQSLLDELRSEISDYEALRDQRRSVIELSSLDELPRALIEGRIAAGLTQRELAERLGVLEQQVQRYEATNYSSASLSRLIEVARAVGVNMREDVFLPHVQVSEQTLQRRLGEAGIDREFVNRILFDEQTNKSDARDASSVLRAAGAAGRIFGWTPTEILAGGQPLTHPQAATAAYFKVYAGAQGTRTIVLSALARYVAQLVVRSTPSLRPQQIPRSARAFRKLVLAKSGVLSLESILDVLWDLGVVVVPLATDGGFHGACWRFGGRNAIVLKQRTASEARWVHDLLHETHHAGADPESPEFVMIDGESMPVERRKSPEEKRATRFAGDVQLDGRAEELALECVTAASKKVEWLKSVVPQIAATRHVSVGALANYLAWRLEMDNINWWGTADKLQEGEGRPWNVARDFLVQRLDWTQLDRVDRQLLTRTLAEE